MNCCFEGVGKRKPTVDDINKSEDKHNSDTDEDCFPRRCSQDVVDISEAVIEKIEHKGTSNVFLTIYACAVHIVH